MRADIPYSFPQGTSVNIDSLDQLLDLIHGSAKANLMFGEGGLIDPERKLPVVTFKLDEKTHSFLRIEDKWWHRRP